MKKILMLFFIVLFLVSYSRANATTPQWTFLIFMNGDNDLEDAAIEDINEMEMIGSTDKVQIIVQIDRNPGYDMSNGNWTDTRRIFIKKDDDPHEITSPVIEKLGEVNMGDYKEFVNFILWGMKNYPAKKYLVCFWNHGAGWADYLDANIYKGISYDDTDETHITTTDLSKALAEVYKTLGRKIDIVAFDACLMGMIEIAYEIKDYAHVMIASEEVEPGDGWPYNDILRRANRKKVIKRCDLAKLIVKTYGLSYKNGSQGTNSVTQSAIRLCKINSVKSALNKLAYKFISNLKRDKEGELKKSLMFCIKKCQSFYYEPYKDLADFAKFVKRKVKKQDIKVIAEKLIQKVKDAVIQNWVHGEGLENSHGLSIYIPNVWNYKEDYATLKFAKDSKWNGFLLNFLDITYEERLTQFARKSLQEKDYIEQRDGFIAEISESIQKGNYSKLEYLAELNAKNSSLKAIRPLVTKVKENIMATYINKRGFDNETLQKFLNGTLGNTNPGVASQITGEKLDK